MSPYDLLFRGGLSRLDAERAHRLAFRAIRAGAPALGTAGTLLGALPLADRLLPKAAGPVDALGLRFPNPLGLAAGFDKNGVGLDALAVLGFGHVEVGTVTGRPQPGNPRPRLFRLVEDRAVVNRMGFNNDGAVAVAKRLAARAKKRAEKGTPPLPYPILGVNIGKTKVVPEDDEAAVIDDYRLSAGLLAPYADYLVVNVSSPNTPGLRDLQAVERLAPLLAEVRRRADEVTRDRRVPLLVKIAPDLSDDDVLAVADMAVASGLDGIIATNTTISREGLRSPAERVAEVGAGGLSGAPLAARATEVLRLLRGRVGEDLTLIGVGGISDATDASARLAAGATLIQAYTGFIYGGPSWPRQVLAGIGGDLS